MLEVEPLHNPRPVLINLAHVSFIERISNADSISAESAPETGLREGTNSEVDVVLLIQTLRSMQGRAPVLESPFISEPTGILSRISSDSNKGGYVLHIGRGELPLAEVAEIEIN
jgi:hypothetical protein